MSLLTLGQFLQTKRLGLGLNVSEASRLTGLVNGSISKYEKDESIPRSKSLAALAKGYGVSLTELQEFIPMDAIVHSVTDRKTPIASLIKNINQLSNKIEECMDGESFFEKNIKRKGLDNLDRVIDLLNGIIILDEAF